MKLKTPILVLLSLTLAAISIRLWKDVAHFQDLTQRGDELILALQDQATTNLLNEVILHAKYWDAFRTAHDLTNEIIMLQLRLDTASQEIERYQTLVETMQRNRIGSEPRPGLYPEWNNHNQTRSILDQLEEANRLKRTEMFERRLWDEQWP